MICYIKIISLKNNRYTLKMTKSAQYILICRGYTLFGRFGYIYNRVMGILIAYK